MKYQCKQGHIFLFPETIHTGSEFNWGEYKKCPECDSIYLTEYVEPEADITSLKKVLHDDVDGMIVKGYKVKEIYAQYVIMVKREVKKEQPDPDDNQAFTETPDQQQIKVNKAYLAKKADQP
jgi:molybdopterin-guanine dinucleotide biosynthesis protein